MLKTNKIVTGVVAFAMVFALAVSFVAPALADTTTTTTTTTAMTSGYAFSSDLTIGSTGPDVVALQNALIAGGYLTMPSGVAEGYFGALTQAALAKMQAAVGISPAAGYFGPITMAYFAAHPALTNGGSMMSSNPNCPTGALYNTMTGQPCATAMTASSTAACPVGYSCVPTGSTTGTTNPGQEGTLTTTQGTPGSNGNIQQNVNVPVYGLQLQAKLGNVTVDRLDLDVQDSYVSNSQNVIENPGNFINNVQVWDGSTVLLNRNVGLNDFITGTSSSDYYIRLSGINDTIPAGTTHNLTVVFSTSGSIDNQRVLTIRGYGSAALSAYSGANNVYSYYDVSGISTTQTFTKPGTATVTLGADVNNPQTMVNYIDPNNGAQNAVLLAFDTNTTQGSSTVNQVTVNLNVSGTNPNGLALYQGATQIAYVGVPTGTNASTTYYFSNIPTSSVVSGNSVYYIKANFPSSTAPGTAASTTVTGVNYLSSNGTIQSTTGVVNGNTQVFNTATAQLAFVSASALPNQIVQNSSSTITATFNFTLDPTPGQEVYPKSSDFKVVAVNGSGQSYPIATSSVGLTLQNSNVAVGTLLPANNPVSVQLTATAASTDLPASGQYTFYITSASTTVYSYTNTPIQYTQTQGLSNYHTSSVYYQRQ